MAAIITTKDKGYADREAYVNETLNDAFRPVEDVRSIRYTTTDTSKEIIKEIIRVESWLGMIAYLDVTALPMEEVLRSIVHLTIAEGEPSNLIVDAGEIRKVARMFS